eukprot:650852-Amphidinium_carterae.1
MCFACSENVCASGEIQCWEKGPVSGLATCACEFAVSRTIAIWSTIDAEALWAIASTTSCVPMSSVDFA